MKSHKCLKKFNDRAQNKFPKELSRLLKSFQQQLPENEESKKQLKPITNGMCH